MKETDSYYIKAAEEIDSPAARIFEEGTDGLLHGEIELLIRVLVDTAYRGDEWSPISHGGAWDDLSIDRQNSAGEKIFTALKKAYPNKKDMFYALNEIKSVGDNLRAAEFNALIDAWNTKPADGPFDGIFDPESRKARRIYDED